MSARAEHFNTASLAVRSTLDLTAPAQSADWVGIGWIILLAASIAGLLVLLFAI